MKKLFVFVILFLMSCEVENYNYIVPVVETYEASSVQINSATLGGIVLSEGGKDVSEYGVVWSTSNPPTINDNKEIKGARLGEFYDSYVTFQPNTKYFYAAYAINEVGVSYGQIGNFTTQVEIPCNPTTNNYINLSTSQIAINNVDVTYPSYSFGDGNIQFETSTSSSTARITVQFDEVDRNFPLTGEYTVTNSPNFGSNINLSEGYAKLFITDWGWGSAGHATAVVGTKFYVENDGTKVNVIFCNTPVGTQYVLNGKFSVTIP